MKHFLILLFFTISLFAFSSGNDSFKFDFGNGRTARGFVKVDEQTVYNNSTGYGFDFVKPPKSYVFGNNALKGDASASNTGFYFSVDLPEGDYRVKVLVGNGERDAVTTVRAESRRLFFEHVKTKKGEFKELIFTTNVRYVDIDKSEKVKIKEREVNKSNWNKKLTIEFNDEYPSVCAVEIERIDNAVTVFLCGNSTVVDQDNEPWCGWGQMIPRFFTEKVSFANYAESGESASSFIGAKRLKKIESKIKAGDYLFIEFGHNDQKQKGEGVGPWGNYTENLKTFIKVARDNNAIPVLVTPMHRRNFDKDGKIVNTLLEYPDAVRKLAADENVALIDLNAMSKILYEAWGVEDSKKAFVHYPANTFKNQPMPLQDNTHFNSYGGYELAKCVVEGIRKNVKGLSKYLRKDYKQFNPSTPDKFEDFYMPLSPFVEIEKPDGN